MFGKSKTIPEAPFNLSSPPDRVRAELYEHYCGRGDDSPQYGTAGCQVNVDAVVVRTYVTDPFRLAVKLGGEWYEMCRVPIGDPGIQQLVDSGDMKDYGPSPEEIERRKQREAEKQAAREAEEAEQQRRREEARRALEERERKRQATVRA